MSDREEEKEEEPGEEEPEEEELPPEEEPPEVAEEEEVTEEAAEPSESPLGDLLAEEPTQERTRYAIDIEIKAEAEKLRDAGELPSEVADKIRARGIAI